MEKTGITGELERVPSVSTSGCDGELVENFGALRGGGNAASSRSGELLLIHSPSGGIFGNEGSAEMFCRILGCERSSSPYAWSNTLGFTMWRSSGTETG